jgi:hypothetical protein
MSSNRLVVENGATTFGKTTNSRAALSITKLILLLAVTMMRMPMVMMSFKMPSVIMIHVKMLRVITIISHNAEYQNAACCYTKLHMNSAIVMICHHAGCLYYQCH